MRSASQQQGGGSIMSRNNKEDDEDELESLRLAALESLRAKGLPPPVVLQGQHVSPKPNICSNAVFQRHFGNQNLIAIIPVESNSANSSPYQNSSPHHLHQHDAKPPPVKNTSSRPPLLKTPPTSSLVSHNSPVEEKRSNKFSRFEDSDSDESDDVEMSFAKSESEEEEFVIEEGDAEDLIIEVEDEIFEEIEEESNGVTEFSPAAAAIPEDRLNVAISGVKPNDKSASSSGLINTLTAPVKITMTDSIKEGHASRDTKHFESNRKTETGDSTRRPPQLSSSATRSPPNAHSRRRSPSRQQRSPQRMQKSSPKPHRSPPRSQRSPVRVQRSPPRVQRSPHRRSPLRLSERNKPKDKGGSKPSSGSDRSAPDESRKNEKMRINTSADSIRSSEKRRTGDKSQVLSRSPKRSVSNDRDSRKLATPSLTELERDRLESRKRKFETAADQDSSVKKEGKIRLRTEVNRKTPPVQLKRREEKLTTKPESVVEQIQVRRNEPMCSVPDKIDEEDADRKLKKSKRTSKKSKDKSRNGKTHSGSDGDNAPIKLAGTKNSDADAHLDLRAELQRRRGHRYEEDEERRSHTPETRRILVLNSPPPSTASAAPPKLPTEPATGVLSKHQWLVSEGQSKSSDPASKRNGRLKLKRTLLATPIDIDQGPETDPLEDRIRLIRAQNELIRKRQQEIEADKLQYA